MCPSTCPDMRVKSWILLVFMRVSSWVIFRVGVLVWFLSCCRGSSGSCGSSCCSSCFMVWRGSRFVLWRVRMPVISFRRCWLVIVRRVVGLFSWVWGVWGSSCRNRVLGRRRGRVVIVRGKLIFIRVGRVRREIFSVMLIMVGIGRVRWGFISILIQVVW